MIMFPNVKLSEPGFGVMLGIVGMKEREWRNSCLERTLLRIAHGLKHGLCMLMNYRVTVSPFIFYVLIYLSMFLCVSISLAPAPPKAAVSAVYIKTSSLTHT